MSHLERHLYCDTIINYTKDVIDYVPVDTTIYDARLAGDLSVDQNGFELLQHRSAVQNWGDLDELERIYYDEITVLAKSLTGCDAVLFYPVLVRSRSPEKSEDHHEPLAFAHSDYTEVYWDNIANPKSAYHTIIGPSMERAGVTREDIVDAKRVVTLQMWRNTGPSDADVPLAFCDSSGVGRSELIELSTPEGYEADFNYFAVSPDAADHCDWYTFPQMKVDELALFRAYDSELVANKEIFWAPHTAFTDPNGGSPRQSVEMRAICLFF